MNNYLQQKKSKVFINKCEKYNVELIEKKMRLGIETLYSEKKSIFNEEINNKRILIKPNLLISRDPEKCVTTNPHVIEAFIRILKDFNNIEIDIGDSPGIGSASNVAKKSGYSYLEQKYDINFVDLNEPIPLKELRELNNNYRFKNLPVSNKLNNYDKIINIAKLKTHGQMIVTLAIKNMFGCISGKNKVKLHLGAGTDVEKFAQMLLELHYGIKPDLNIIDGIMAMEGNGPGNGAPRAMYTLAMSEDALSLDSVICELIRFDKNEIPIFSFAKKMNFDFDNIEIVGDKIDELIVDDFLKAQIKSVQFIMPFLPQFIVNFLKRIFTAKPKIDHKKCILCKVCIKHCPASVMSIKSKRVIIDYNRCIRCFCCQELCPEGAIKIKNGI